MITLRPAVVTASTTASWVVLPRFIAERDLQPIAAVRLRGVDQLLAVLLGYIPAGDGQRERGRSDRSVLRYPGRRRLGDVVDLRRLVEERVDALLRGRAVGTALVPPDDVDLLTGVAGELPLREVARGLRLRPRRVVVGVVLARERRAQADGHHHRRDPNQDDRAAAAAGEIGETGEQTRHSGAPFSATGSYIKT